MIVGFSSPASFPRPKTSRAFPQLSPVPAPNGADEHRNVIARLIAMAQDTHSSVAFGPTDPAMYTSEYTGTYVTPDYELAHFMPHAGVAGNMAKAMEAALHEEALAKQVDDPSLTAHAHDFDNVYSSKFRNFDTASQISMGDHLNFSRSYVPKPPVFAGYDPVLPKKGKTEYFSNYGKPADVIATMQSIIDEGKVTSL